LADLDVAAASVSDNRFRDPHQILMAIMQVVYFVTRWMNAMPPG